MDYFERRLDDKNRLTLPPELRDSLTEVVIARGFGQYLHMYPKTVWDKDIEQALVGDILDEKIADLNVQFRMGKIDVRPDSKQGRITLEQHLLDYAGIDRDLVVVRAGKYWRIMSKKMAEKSANQTATGATKSP